MRPSRASCDQQPDARFPHKPTMCGRLQASSALPRSRPAGARKTGGRLFEMGGIGEAKIAHHAVSAVFDLACDPSDCPVWSYGEQLKDARASLDACGTPVKPKRPP